MCDWEGRVEGSVIEGVAMLYYDHTIRKSSRANSVVSDW